jgi:hypothetical protein
MVERADRPGRSLRLAAWGCAGLLFLLPLAAEQLSDEMDWSMGDFIVWAAMLVAACGAFELAMRLSANWAYRTAAAVAIGAGFLLVWINLAVGIIGSEDNAANLLYAGVLAIGVVGAVVADFRPHGMARALIAMALAQTLIAAVALIAEWGSDGENWPQVIFVLNGFFATLWLLSAGLFRRAAREEMPAGPRP